jgi:hypothetical protein
LAQSRVGLRIIARYGVANHHELWVGYQMIGVKTRQNIDPNLREVTAHGRVNILVGSRYAISARL